MSSPTRSANRSAPSVRVPSARSGYPGVAHGGYVAGVVGSALAGTPARVQFCRPVAVDRDLALAVGADRRVATLRDGERVLVTASMDRVTTDPGEIPEPPTLAEAKLASAGFPAADRHRQPRCFGCGTGLGPADGLRIATGRVHGRDLVAGAWRPPAWTAAQVGDGEFVDEALIWAALDCPGAWAAIRIQPLRGHQVTVALEVDVVRRVRVARYHVVVGWVAGGDEQSRDVGSAIYTADGDLCATGRARWVARATALQVR